MSFIARHVLDQTEGAIDAMMRGEGEVGAPALPAAVPDGAVHEVSGAVTSEDSGPAAPEMLTSIDRLRPARDLLRRRHRGFIGVLDPAASIEFTRGCPWDCSFCSARAFYGRSYRKASPEAAADELASIREPGVFIVDDVAFIKPEHGDGIAKMARIVGRHLLHGQTDFARMLTLSCLLTPFPEGSPSGSGAHYGPVRSRRQPLAHTALAPRGGASHRG